MTPKIIDYTIIYAKGVGIEQTLSKGVLEMISQGWQPIGGPTTYVHEKMIGSFSCLGQAMVKYEQVHVQ